MGKRILFISILSIVCLLYGCKGKEDEEVDPCQGSTLTAKFDPGYKIVTIQSPMSFKSKCEGDTTGITHLWDFGDSTTSTEYNPKHIYDSAGIYTVKLSVRNACGLTSKTTRTVKIWSMLNNMSLGVTRVGQPVKMWSWAACAEMVLNSFYKPATQCAILSTSFNANCCNSPNLCNQQRTLEQICSSLKKNGGLQSVIKDSALTFDELRLELANGRPVIIEYNNLNEGHLAVIYAFDNYFGQKVIYIYDPFYENPDRRYKDFDVEYATTFTYKGTLQWTRSIYGITD